MSYGFRERLKEALLKDLREKLGLSQKDVQYVLENIMKICPVSDEFANALKKHEARFRGKSLDEIMDMLTKEEFEEFVDEVLKEAFNRLGYKKKKKKQIESSTDSDSQSDSDSDGSKEPLEEQQAQAECEQKNE